MIRPSVARSLASRLANVRFLCQVLFVYIDIEEDDHQRIMEFFGLKTEECPSMRYINLGQDMTKYKPETADLDKDTIQKFVQGVIDGDHKVGIVGHGKKYKQMSIGFENCFKIIRKQWQFMGLFLFCINLLI